MSKRKRGDRRDGTLIRDLDSMHYIMPLMYPNRCDNEAYISEIIDLTKTQAYLDKKNSENPEYKYNLFQLVVTAVVKTITLRPKMNRFVANYNMYQRNEVSAAFTIKKIFSDNGEEALAFLHTKPTDNIDSIHDEIYRQVSAIRVKDEKDSATDTMDTIQKLPLFLKRWIGYAVRFLDKRGKMPQSLIEGDPYQSSVVLSNLGSIKLHAGYHHLTNWGTTSILCIIGERKPRLIAGEDGKEELRDSVDLGLTIDERLADGYYYSKTVRLLRTLLENPELLELPLDQPVEY
ncbi:MAG: 2-oxo acid dehydrogenase subunit E2 [Firmicutes bacterium]|nr:2-oxo acid dehydrogenase subunit E2 [Bacillota bacterium]